MKLIDYDQDIQELNGLKSNPKMTLGIKTLKKLVSGTQADVYQCRVKGMVEKFVNKTRKIYYNKELAEAF